MKNRLIPLALLLLGLMSTASTCSNSQTGPEFERQEGIRLQPQRFWPLIAGQGFYELWLGVPAAQPGDGENPWEVEQHWIAAAPFRVTGDGKVADLSGRVTDFFSFPPDLDTSRIARGLISYQPPSDEGKEHEVGMLLAIGDFVAPGATITTTLSWDSDEVFPKDLREPQGHFRLRAATAEGGENLPRGVWFFDPMSTGLPSLQLGTPLPEGYIYEAWAFQRDVLGSLIPVQIHPLGRFAGSTGPDSDGAGPYAQPGGTVPAFPGQDFVQGLVLDLNDGSWWVMITVEPAVDAALAVPSSLRILETSILQTDGIDVPIILTNRAQHDGLPQSIVTVVR